MIEGIPELTPWIFGLLFAAGCFAGIVDAISGGGGLIAVPTLMLCGLPPHFVLGTNKGQSVIGTAMAMGKFSKTELFDRKRARRAFLPAMIGSILGVCAVVQISREILSVIIIGLLLFAGIFILIYRPRKHRGLPKKRGLKWLAPVAFAIAFYDGFFGPGAGIFFIMAYVLLWNDPLHHASANAKAVNLASNASACLVFSIKGMVLWKFAAPMALGQAIGGYTGAHLTIKAGPNLVRILAVVISFSIILRLAWGLFLK